LIPCRADFADISERGTSVPAHWWRAALAYCG
jgi:hypothetical protein